MATTSHEVEQRIDEFEAWAAMRIAEIIAEIDRSIENAREKAKKLQNT